MAACVTAGATSANEKKFSGVNPNLYAGSGWTISGQMYPQRGLDPSNRPADCFAEFIHSLDMVRGSSPQEGKIFFTFFASCYYLWSRTRY
jgi:hypothetical protein